MYTNNKSNNNNNNCTIENLKNNAKTKRKIPLFFFSLARWLKDNCAPKTNPIIMTKTE